MLKLWFIETLVLAPGTWQTEPWFAGVECYRDLDEAEKQLESWLDHYRDLATADRAEQLARWKAQFGGHAPPPHGPRDQLARGCNRSAPSICRTSMFRDHPCS